MSKIVPSVGDILHCMFPEKKTRNEPGVTPHPVLVLKTSNAFDGQAWVTCAFGTGNDTPEKNTKYSYQPGHILITGNDIFACGLAEETVFQVNNLAELPVDNNFFKNLPGSQSIKIGRIPENLRSQHRDMVAEALKQAAGLRKPPQQLSVTIKRTITIEDNNNGGGN